MLYCPAPSYSFLMLTLRSSIFFCEWKFINFTHRTNEVSLIQFWSPVLCFAVFFSLAAECSHKPSKWNVFKWKYLLLVLFICPPDKTAYFLAFSSSSSAVFFVVFFFVICIQIAFSFERNNWLEEFNRSIWTLVDMFDCLNKAPSDWSIHKTNYDILWFYIMMHFSGFRDNEVLLRRKVSHFILCIHSSAYTYLQCNSHLWTLQETHSLLEVLRLVKRNTSWRVAEVDIFSNDLISSHVLYGVALGGVQRNTLLYSKQTRGRTKLHILLSCTKAHNWAISKSGVHIWHCTPYRRTVWC